MEKKLFGLSALVSVINGDKWSVFVIQGLGWRSLRCSGVTLPQSIKKLLLLFAGLTTAFGCGGICERRLPLAAL
jgi:hypothetical protein